MSTRAVTCRPRFTNNQQLELIASDGTKQYRLGTVHASADGSFSKTVTIPADAAGVLQIYVTGYRDPCPDNADCAPHLAEVHVHK